MIKLVAALVVSVGLLLADRQLDLGVMIEKGPALRERWFPKPKAPPVVRGQKHFDAFCECDTY